MCYGRPVKRAAIAGTVVVALAALLASVAVRPQAPETKKDSTGGAQPSTKPGASNALAQTRPRRIPCKTRENASVCYRTKGRLSVYNGNPSLRIWKIGTHRILGIFNGPSHFPPQEIADNENPDLPSSVERAYAADRRRWERDGESAYDLPDIFADFEVCPLEPEKPGWMQAVCIESAAQIFIDKNWR